MQRKRLHEEKDIWFGLAFCVAERRPIKPNREATKSCIKFDTKDGGVVMRIVKTWCENTKEGEQYLRYNYYEKAKRILNTDYYICRCIGLELSDVEIIW